MVLHLLLVNLVFVFLGSAANVDLRYKPGFGYFQHLVGNDGTIDPLSNNSFNDTTSNPFNYNETGTTKSAEARRHRQKKSLYNLETLGNTHDDDVAIAPTMETLRSDFFPPFIDVLTPLKSDVIYDSHPHTRSGSIAVTETTTALQSYLSTYGYILGELHEEEFADDDTCLMPFLLLCERAIDAEELDIVHNGFNTAVVSPIIHPTTSTTPNASPQQTTTTLASKSKDITINIHDGPIGNNDVLGRSKTSSNADLRLTDFANERLTASPSFNKTNNSNDNLIVSPSSYGVKTPLARPPPQPKMKKGITYHARYQYRLLALENTPTYIADPLSHPDEYMTILIETLNLLNYLPSVEQRLQKQSADCIRQIISREVGALAHQVLQLSIQSYHQSSYAWRGSKGMVSLIGKMTNSELYFNNHNTHSSTSSQRGLNQILKPMQCSPQQHYHDPHNPFSQNIVQHHNIITALLPWQNTSNEVYNDEVSRSTKNRFGAMGYNNNSSDDDTPSTSRQNNDEDIPLSLTQQDKRRQKRKNRIAGKNLYKDGQDGINEQMIRQGVIKMLQKDVNFQSQMLSDLLVVICKICVRVLVNQKQALTHITALKNINMFDLEQRDMSIQQYHQIITDAYTKPDVLIGVQETSRKTYNTIQIQIQQLIWRFWEKQQLPLIFSIDDEITQQIFNNSNYNQYKNNASNSLFGGALSNFSSLNPFSHPLGGNVFSNIQNLTPQQFFQQLFHIDPLSNGQRATRDHTGGISSHNQPSNTDTPHTKSEAQEKEDNLKFTFGNSRTSSIAHKQVQAETGQQDYEQEARERAAKQREQRRKEKEKKKSFLQGYIDDEWDDAEDDADADLLRSESDDKSSWLISNPYNISLVYLPILHFADMCNALVDGVDHCPYLPPPPMYSLFPHLLKSNLKIAKFAYSLLKRHHQYEQSRTNALLPNGKYVTKIPNNSIPTIINLASPQITTTSSSSSTSKNNNTNNKLLQPLDLDPTPQLLKPPTMNDFLVPIVDLRSAIESRLRVEEATKRSKDAQDNDNKKYKRDDNKKNTNNDQFSPYNLLPQHLLHLLPNIQKHTLNTLGTVRDALHLPKNEIVSGSVNVQPRLLGPSVVNSITNTTIWVRTNIFRPYPLPSIRSLLQNTRINTSFLHSSYPLTQCLALAIQDIFLPRLHKDIIHSIERILNSPNAFKPYDNSSSQSSLLGPQTSINLAQYELDPNNEMGTYTPDVVSDTMLLNPTDNKNNDLNRRGSQANLLTNVQAQVQTGLDTNNKNQNNIDPNATAQIEANLVLGNISTTDHSISQLYRVAVYQEAAYETNEPFKRLYHFFANLYKGTMSSQLLLEGLLQDPDYYNSTAHSASIVENGGAFDGFAFGPHTGSPNQNSNNDSVLAHQHYQQQHSKQRHLSSAIGLTTGKISATERELPSTAAGLLKRLRTSPYFTGSKTVMVIRCAYDLSLLLEALSQDMCLLPQFSHHIMTLFQHAVDSFIERVQIKYMEVTQCASNSSLFSSSSTSSTTSSTTSTTTTMNPDSVKTAVYPTRILNNRINIDAMASDLWFLDFRGIPRSNKQHTRLYSVVQQQLMKNGPHNKNSIYYNPSGPKGYYDISSSSTSTQNKPQGRIRSSTLVGNQLQLPNGTTTTTNNNGTTTTTTTSTTVGKSSFNNIERRLLDPICEFYIDTFFSTYNPALKELLHKDFTISPGQLFHQTPLDLTANNTMLRMQQNLTVNEASIGSFFSFGDKSKKQPPSSLSTTTKSLNGNNNNNNNSATNNKTPTDTSLSAMNMASAITSRAQSAIKPVSYLALLATSLDWLSNFLYHLSIPGNRPVSLAEAASTSTSTLPSSNKQTVMESNFSTSNSTRSLSKIQSTLSPMNRSSQSFSNNNKSTRDGLITSPSILQESPSLLDFVQLQRNTNVNTFQFNQQLTLIPLYDPNSTGLGNILSAFSKQQFVGGNNTNNNNSNSNTTNNARLASNTSLAKPSLTSHNSSTNNNNNNSTSSTTTQQPLMMVPGSLSSGTYIPLLANMVPACYQNTAASSTQAIYDSVAQDMSGTSQYIGGLTGSNNTHNNNFLSNTIERGNSNNKASTTNGFTTGSAINSDGNPYSSTRQLQTSALDNATSVLRSYTSLVSMFIAPTYSTLFAANPFGYHNNDDNSIITTTTTKDGSSTTTTTTTTNTKKNKNQPQTTTTTTNNPNVSSAATHLGGINTSGYAQFFDLSLGNGNNTSYSMNDLIASSITQPLLQYNPLDSYQSTLALSRCLALTKMLPDAVQVRMYVTEEAALRYLDEEKWRSYLIWNGIGGPGSVNPLLNLNNMSTMNNNDGLSNVTLDDYALSVEQIESENQKKLQQQQQLAAKEKNNNKDTQQMTLTKVINTLSSTDSELNQFYSLLSTKRFELAHKLYELSNICMFTIKLEIICRVVLHLKNSILSNYNIKPTLFSAQENNKVQNYKRLQRHQRTGLVLQQSANVRNTIHNLLQNVDTEAYILDLNKDLITIEESLIRFWDPSRIHYVFGGISYLISSILINNFQYMPLKLITPLGIRCIHRNLHSLQQNLSNSLPTQHNLALLTAFPQYFHHHPNFNDMQFARVREYTELMKCTLNSLPSQAQQRMFKFTDVEFATLVEIITNNRLEKDKHFKASQAEKQFLLSQQSTFKRVSQQAQQRKQRDHLAQNENVLKQDQVQLEIQAREREKALKQQLKQERLEKRAKLAAERDAATQGDGTTQADVEKPDGDDDKSDEDDENPSQDQLNRWAAIDKDFKIERKRGPGGQTTVVSTHKTVITTGVGDAPVNQKGVIVGTGGPVNNTTAALLAKANNNQNEQRQIILKQSESPSNANSTPSKSRFNPFSLFGKK